MIISPERQNQTGRKDAPETPVIKKKKRKHSFISKVVLGINAIFALLLLISEMSPYIDPRDNWMVAFFGLAYPVFLMINVGFIIFWIFIRKPFWLLSLLVILIGFNVLTRTFTYSSRTDSLPPKSFKIMSYNVRNFDVYNYHPDWSFNCENRDNIFSLLNFQQPDIICFQEYFYESSGQFKTTDTLRTFLKAGKYRHISFWTENRRTNFFGMAIFSKYPIIEKGEIKFSTRSNNFGMYSDVVVFDDTIRIYNIHLESIRLNSQDYKYAEKVQRGDDVDDNYLKEGGFRIFKRLHAAFERRSEQAEIIAEHIQKSPYPVILCGDFNDTPTSYSYQRIANLLNDAFKEAGRGLGQSYAGKFIPSYRIDYIMHDPKMKAYNFEVIHEKFSDHYPVQVVIEP